MVDFSGFCVFEFGMGFYFFYFPSHLHADRCWKRVLIRSWNVTHDTWFLERSPIGCFIENMFVWFVWVFDEVMVGMFEWWFERSILIGSFWGSYGEKLRVVGGRDPKMFKIGARYFFEHIMDFRSIFFHRLNIYRKS